MTRPPRFPRRPALTAARRLASSDDSGAALLFVLIFITVVAVVIAAVLSYTEANMRGTVAVRTQANRAAAADGAAQIAINKLRDSDFSLGTVGGDCFGPGNPNLPLPNFYQNVSGATYSATVTCDLDGDHSSITGGQPIGSSNRPGQAILTLGTGGEVGLDLNANGGQSIIVHGAVRSNSNIQVDELKGNVPATATGDCSVGTYIPPANCNTGVITQDPGQAPATANLWRPDNDPRTVQSVPACAGPRGIVDFNPGIYNSLSALNNLTKNNGCRNGIFHFKPGTYYFEFNGEWLLDTGWLIGGTLSPQVVPGQTPSMPGSCLSPIQPDPAPPNWTPPPPNAGVQFVFSGTSRIHMKQSQMEVCATFHNDRMPIALYGLANPMTTGGPSVPAESGCIITVGGSGCPVLLSDNSPQSKLFIQGTTYVPRAFVDISLNNNTGQVFRYGIVARRLSVDATASANLNGPVIEVPDNSPGGHLRTVLYLQVYACTGPTACPTSGGQPALRVKVGIEDDNGIVTPGDRQITVYDWSVQR